MLSRILASGKTFGSLDVLPKGSAGTLNGRPKCSAMACTVGLGSGITAGVGLFGSALRTFGVGLLGSGFLSSGVGLPGSGFRSTRGGVL